jgi:general L-amino acid transport system permease protein
MVDQLEFLLSNLPNLLIGFPGQRPGGLLMSLLLTVFGVGIGFVIAIIVGSGRESKFLAARWLSQLYVGVFLGLPLVLLLILIHQVVGGKRFGLDLSPRDSALIALALYSGAYQVGIVRSGLRAVPIKLAESARVMGSSPWHVYWTVKLGYATRVMLPAFVGQAISLFKDTSVVVIIAVADLMTVARSVLGSNVAFTQHWLSLYLLVGFLYFCVAFAISRLARRWEKRAPSGALVHSLANY